MEASLHVQLINSLAIDDRTRSPALPVAGGQGWDPKFQPSNRGVGSPDNQPPSQGYLGAFQKPLINSKKHLYNTHGKVQGFSVPGMGRKTKQYPYYKSQYHRDIRGDRSSPSNPSLSLNRKNRPQHLGALEAVRRELLPSLIGEVSESLTSRVSRFHWAGEGVSAPAGFRHLDFRTAVFGFS